MSPLLVAMKRSWTTLACLLVLVGTIASSACGARSELRSGVVASGGAGGTGTGGAGPVCVLDADCGAVDACLGQRCSNGVCLALPTDCSDGDPCTEDTCEPLLGCAHRPLALDTDGDGRRGPRPGRLAGSDGACGDDCNDRSAAAFPGNREVCDGVDNDCNGVVDDGMTYVASKTAPIRVSTVANVRAFRLEGSIVGTPDGYVLTYNATVPKPGGKELSRALIKGLSPSGQTLWEHHVSEPNAETYPGPLAWSGEVLATAWDDARVERNYEVYLGRFSPKGEKLAADQRVTNAPLFSKNPILHWNQAEFVLVWDDSRRQGELPGDPVSILGQRAAPDGSLLGSEIPLIDDGAINENPVLALGPERLALVYTMKTDKEAAPQIGFQLLDAALTRVGVRSPPFANDVFAPAVYFAGGRFIVLWQIYPAGASPGDFIWGATFDTDGNLLLPPRPVTSGGRFARSHEALSLGDRLLLTWSDEADGNQEIYWQILGPDLQVIAPRQRLTFGPGDSRAPALAVGPDGKIGVEYSDNFEGTPQVYFTTLECAISTP